MIIFESCIYEFLYVTFIDMYALKKNAHFSQFNKNFEVICLYNMFTFTFNSRIQQGRPYIIKVESHLNKITRECTQYSMR